MEFLPVAYLFYISLSVTQRSAKKKEPSHVGIGALAPVHRPGAVWGIFA